MTTIPWAFLYNLNLEDHSTNIHNQNQISRCETNTELGECQTWIGKDPAYLPSGCKVDINKTNER